MARPRTKQPKRIFMNVQIDEELKDKLDAFSKKKGVIKKKIVELAIRDFIESREATEVLV